MNKKTSEEERKTLCRIIQLQTCVWEITLACCYSCKYCGSKAGKARINELSTAECIDVAGQLAELGCRRATLIGGEVFMRQDWGDIVDSLASNGIKTSIITNGYPVNGKLIRDLNKAGIESIAVSLDGPEDVHDAFRQQGSYNCALKAIEAISDSGIPVSVISTIHSKNITRLEELFKVLNKQNIFAWQIQACSPMGNASKNPNFTSEIDFSEMIHFVKSHIGKASFSILLADNIGYFTKEEGFLRGNRDGKGVYSGCLAGIRTIGIDSIGNVRGCLALYDDCFIEGNIRNKSLHDIWIDKYSFAYNRQFSEKLLTGKCNTCKYGRICAGGCRSYNYFSHGKLYESPNCARWFNSLS